MNSIVLSGYLVTDPDIKFYRKENAIALTVGRALMAVPRGTSFDVFCIIAFGSRAEFLGNHFEKDSRLMVRGELRNYVFADAYKVNVRHHVNYIVARELNREEQSSPKLKIEEQYIKELDSILPFYDVLKKFEEGDLC